MGSRSAAVVVLIVAVVLAWVAPRPALAQTAAPVSFGVSELASTSLTNPTSMEFGPDERLYVSQQNGLIKAFTIEREGADDYTIVDAETISAIQAIPNHDDDGSSSSTGNRQVTGLMTAGTASNPVLYVTSSDPRIGGGPVGSDLDLDTNSGVLSRLTWNGSAWDHVQLVRGLPRSEENHSTNGMDLDPTTNTLFVMSGGHTNQGAPSNNFSGTPEYALSGAMLSIDLDAIDALPVSSDGPIDHVHDLPTLQDPSGDSAPFGGEDGANMAILVEGGPVQIHSPGYRNAYDVVRTEAGELYTFDNGANGAWGGTPVVAGTSCTNELENGGTTQPDSLHHVSEAGYYGGHPNPTRATPDSGLIIYTKSGDGSWSPSASYDWGDFAAPPVPASYQAGGQAERECDYLAPGAANGALATVGSSTNGLTEYTASNFGGAMTGDLLAAAFNGTIYRFQLTSSGEAVATQSSLFSGFGSVPLDVTTLGDDGPFPGTVWAATYGSDDVTVFEPADYGGSDGFDCDLSDPDGDADGDGFSNADEVANGADPCSAGSQPVDADGDGISDILDDDDDDDGVPDVDDIFPLDADDGRGPDSVIPAACPDSENTSTTTCLRFQAGSFPGTLLDLGFTGVMRNLGGDYLDDIDDDPLPGGGTNIKRGGASEQLTITEVGPGDAVNTTNTQKNAFLFGVDPATAPGGFSVRTRVQNFPDDPVNYQSAGLFVGTGTQDDYVKLVVNPAAAGGSGAVGPGGIQFAKEVGASFNSVKQIADSSVTEAAVQLILDVDPVAGTIAASYAIGSGSPIALGKTTVPTAWFEGATGLAVGVIATSYPSASQTFTADWDLLEVFSGSEPVDPDPTDPDPTDPDPTDPDPTDPDPTDPDPTDPDPTDPDPTDPDPTDPDPTDPDPTDPDPTDPDPTDPDPVDPTPVDPDTGGPDPVEPTPVGPFSDTPGTTHAEAIAAVAAAQIASGYPDGTYRPNASVTRGQMASFLMRALELPAGAAAPFSDTPGTTHAEAIAAVAAAQIASGYPDGTYRPNASVTRGQMASFLMRALELPAGAVAPFTDTPGTTHAEAIAAVAAAEIASGYPDGTYRPNASVTRGQMASFLARALGL